MMTGTAVYRGYDLAYFHGHQHCIVWVKRTGTPPTEENITIFQSEGEAIFWIDNQHNNTVYSTTYIGD